MAFYFSVLAVIFVYAVFSLIRNNWVYRTRIKWIDQDVHEYERTVSYGTMMLRFWNWKPDMDYWKQ